MHTNLASVLKIYEAGDVDNLSFSAIIPSRAEREIPINISGEPVEILLEYIKKTELIELEYGVSVQFKEMCGKILRWLDQVFRKVL